MIHVRRTRELPALEKLSDFGQFDVETVRKTWGSIRKARMWEVYDNEIFLGQFGVHEGSPLGTGTALWFYAGRDFCRCRRATLRRLHRILGRVCACWPHVRVYVKQDFALGERFAQFMGFSLAATTDEYKVYEIWTH